MIDILFLLLWWIFLLGLPAFCLYYKAFWYGIILFFLVAMGSIATHYYYRDAYPIGTIREDIMVRVGPHETYGTCGMFKANDKVVLCDMRDTWKQVQKIDCAVRGWIPQEYVTIDIS